MKFLNKYFFFGILTGIAITLLVIAGIIAGSYLYYTKSYKGTGEGMESKLQAPRFHVSEAMADYDWTIKSLDGQEISMTEMKGKVVFLNFWATWCPPCIAEMPSIQKLYEQVNDGEIQIACISREDAEKVKKFVEEKGFTFPIYTTEAEIPEVFETRGIPATFILSSNEKIAFKHTGAAKWDDETCIEFLKRLK